MEPGMYMHSYFITLRSREDRRRNFEKWAFTTDAPWSKLTKKATAFVAVKHSKGPQYGCWDSHVGVMRMALEAGAPFACIFEDDAIPVNLPEKTWKSVLEEIDAFVACSGWDMIALGGTPVTWIQKPHAVTKHIRLAPFIETHAYIVSADFMRKTIATPFTGSLDHSFVRRAATTSYVVAPELFEQDPAGGSDIKLGNVVAFRGLYKLANAKWAETSPLRGRDLAVILLVCCGILLGHACGKHVISRSVVLAFFLLLLASVYIGNEITQDAYIPRRTRMDDQALVLTAAFEKKRKRWSTRTNSAIEHMVNTTSRAR